MLGKSRPVKKLTRERLDKLLANLAKKTAPKAIPIPDSECYIMDYPPERILCLFAHYFGQDVITPFLHEVPGLVMFYFALRLGDKIVSKFGKRV